MRPLTSKSGGSAPRKSPKVSPGFSPRGRISYPPRLFPEPLQSCQKSRSAGFYPASVIEAKGHDGDEEDDKDVWMSVWVHDVDETHKHCVVPGLEVAFPPTDMPWNVREMHLRHPDGHVFRVSRGFEPEK